MTISFTIPAEHREQSANRLREYFIHCLPGNELTVTIEKTKKDRTLPQLRYLNGVAIELLCKALGFENEDMREYLNGEFFGWREKHLPGGRIVEVPNRTTTTNELNERDVISDEKFATYIKFVQRFAASHGIYIPDPDPRYWMSEQNRVAACLTN